MRQSNSHTAFCQCSIARGSSLPSLEELRLHSLLLFIYVGLPDSLGPFLACKIKEQKLFIYIYCVGFLWGRRRRDEKRERRRKEELLD